MNYKKLGNTEIDVSTICLGTMTWGEQNTQEEGFEQMDYALDQGVNFWDTAEIYSIPPKQETFGDTEVIIGNWFEKTKKREKVILASKVCGPMREYVRGGGNQFGTKNINEALEGSLRRLKTDYIDLFQLHWPERITNTFGIRGFKYSNEEKWKENFETVLQSLKELIDKGKIRQVGLSNENPWGFMKFLELSKKQLPKMITIQNPYNLLNRLFEIGNAEVCIRENTGLLAYSPLGFGMLSGKYLNGNMPEDSRLKLFPTLKRFSSNESMKATRLYMEIALRHNLSLTQMSLAFVNSRPFVTSNIIGASKLCQLKENIESIQVDLSDEILSEIEKVHEMNPNPAP